MLVSMFHSGTSKTMQVVLVHLDLPSFCMEVPLRNLRTSMCDCTMWQDCEKGLLNACHTSKTIIMPSPNLYVWRRNANMSQNWFFITHSPNKISREQRKSTAKTYNSNQLNWSQDYIPSIRSTCSVFTKTNIYVQSKMMKRGTTISCGHIISSEELAILVFELSDLKLKQIALQRSPYYQFKLGNIDQICSRG